MVADPKAEQSRLALRLYAAYREIRDGLPVAGKFMPYGWRNLPNPLGAIWMAYSQMLDEFSSELANIVNDLTNHVHRLQAWATVVPTLSDDEKMEATHEFIDVLATNAVNLPYVIRSRFAFAAAHLCHQANMAKNLTDWKDDLPLDGEIWLNTTDLYGRGWRRYTRFKRRVEAIGASQYKESTLDFRNAYNHRFSPKFVIGMTNLVSRHVNETTGQICYGFGGRKPFDLDNIADLLATERERCYSAFEAFQVMVREHESAITAFEEAERAARS